MLMLLVFLGIAIGIQYWHARTAPPAPENAPAATAPATTAPAAAPATTAEAAAAAAQTPSVQASAESTTVVENELYKITFSNRGGQVTSWILKRY
jgi:YidC/Oxa1 family membrane protein insertase